MEQGVALTEPRKGSRTGAHKVDEQVEAIGPGIAPVDADGAAEHHLGFALDSKLHELSGKTFRHLARRVGKRKQHIVVAEEFHLGDDHVFEVLFHVVYRFFRQHLPVAALGFSFWIIVI